MMHRNPAFLPTLFIIICLLLLHSSHYQGYGRGLGVALTDIQTVKYHDVANEGIGKLRRKMVQLMDYDEPGANTNPKYGFLVSPPPAPPPPPHPF